MRHLALLVLLAGTFCLRCRSFTLRIRPGLPRSPEKRSLYDKENPRNVRQIFRAPGEDGALQRHLSSQPLSVARQFQDLQEHLRGVEEKVRRTRGDRESQRSEDKCAANNAWARNARYYLNLRGLAGNTEECEVLTPIERAEMPDLPRLHATLNSIGLKFARSAVGNWSNAFHVGRFVSNKDLANRCTLYRQAAVRVGGSWFLQVQFTNRPVDEFRASRVSSSEYVWRSKSVYESLGMYLIDQSSRRQLAATSFYRRPGRRSVGAFGQPKLDDNPSLLEAISLNEKAHEQATEQVQPGNVAILLFPILLTLVPVALLTDVSKIWILLYTVLTDVLTQLPLVIKGAELIVASKSKQKSGHTFFAGKGDSSKYIATAEVFVAECVLSEEFFGRGVAFVATGLSFMIIGVVLEFAALYFVNRYRRTQADET